jgi:intracellular septation protein
MKILFDLFPVILFFATFKFSDDIFLATGVAIIATFVQVAWVKFHRGKVDNMLWVSLGIITVMGGATLLLHDENFIKWKPTVLYWLFTLVLVLSDVFFKKNLIRSFLQEKVTLPSRVWTQMNYSWGLFFAVLGFINLYVAYNYSLDSWVNFKLFGFSALMFVFILLQAAWMSKYTDDDKKESN